MTYFPFYCDIEQKKWLLVGGGRVAAGKFSRLIAFTEKITVIAPDISSEIRENAPSGVLFLERDFEEADLGRADIVVAATGDRQLNAWIASACRSRGIPVNAVDDPDNCDFIFPAIIKRGRLTVSVSTDGASPVYAAALKKEISDLVPEDIDLILEKMAALRKTVPERFPSFTQHERGMLYRKALDQLLDDSGSEVDIDSLAEEISRGRE
ncbi:MAG: bifunctional precorrin-2 dehydrogenase/sirohydrochlorin ferrochelatase [Lachnospiraceae bacterium]|nr:bifunctional precorrin-2 dehydrogenase/sirohydrochlorin ferrochelatase [Lachnospiraceae bacterium]